MRRNTMLKILNPILGVLFLNQVVTGILNEVLPREVFEILHEGGGYVFAAVAILHLILNWNWIKANYFRKSIKAG